MSTTENADDAATDETEEQQTYPWVNQGPDTRLVGTLREDSLIYGGDVTAEQNDSNFALRLESPSTVMGTTYKNTILTDEDEERSMAEIVDDHDEDVPRSSSYRVVNEDNLPRGSQILGGQLGTGEEFSGAYDEISTFDTDEIQVWYNGLAGTYMARTLDFLGGPFAGYSGSGYLMKGLFQATDEWRRSNPSEYSRLSDEGQAPRVVRFPRLRDDVVDEQVLIELSADGRAYRINIYKYDDLDDPTADELDEDAKLDMLFIDSYGDGEDAIDELSTDNPFDTIESIVTDEDMMFNLQHGGPWGEKPANAKDGATSDRAPVSVETDLDDDTGADDDQTADEAAQEQVVESFVHSLKGKGVPPEKAFNTRESFEGAVETTADKCGASDVDADEIRAALYEELSHLDADDFEADRDW